MIVAAIIAPDMRTRVSQNIMCGSSPVSGVPALLLCALTKHSPPGENCEFCYKDETNCDIMDTINRKQGCISGALSRTAGDDNLSIAE